MNNKILYMEHLLYSLKEMNCEHEWMKYEVMICKDLRFMLAWKTELESAILN